MSEDDQLTKRFAVSNDNFLKSIFRIVACSTSVIARFRDLISSSNKVHSCATRYVNDFHFPFLGTNLHKFSVSFQDQLIISVKKMILKNLILSTHRT